MTKDEITPKQKHFLAEYARSLDMEKALRAAGYKNSNVKAVGLAMLQKEKYRRELGRIILEKAAYLEISRGYIIKKYLELIDYASFQDNDKGGAPNDPVLALRALDGLCKQLSRELIGDGAEGTPLEMRLEGLNTGKI